jgi:hypothetical protein
VSAQSYFRENDVDGNGTKDYWRGDLAGLYTVKEAKLIELSIGGADDRATTDIGRYIVRSPKAGYWFHALRFSDEKTPDPDRWAACAFPDGPSSGSQTFIVSHEGVIHARKGVLRELAIYPSSEELTRDWIRLETPSR